MTASYASRSVTSDQQGPHEGLLTVVDKYRASDFLKPIADHSHEAYESVQAWLSEWHGPLVLDSCCGVGESTRELARRHPDALVIGIDKSAHRIDKHAAYRQDVANYRVIRADLNDLWRLLVADGVRLAHHYLLYPNPWPKAKHLQRRWHGGALLPTLLQLGGCLEVRSNWATYIEEFALALDHLDYAVAVDELPKEHEPITPFERKYQGSGQSLWRLVSQLC